MSNLTELRIILDQLTVVHGTRKKATLYIAWLMGKSDSTVYQWLSDSQIRPISDNELERLRLKLATGISLPP